MMNDIAIGAGQFYTGLMVVFVVGCIWIEEGQAILKAIRSMWTAKETK
jgi:hypothetical protein